MRSVKSAVKFVSGRAQIKMGMAGLLVACAGVATGQTVEIRKQAHAHQLLVNGAVIADSLNAVVAPNAISSGQTSVVTWRETDSRGITTPYYAFSRDGIEWSRAINGDNTVLNLRWSEFDPLLGGAPVQAHLLASPDSNLYIVQFIVPPIETMRDSLEKDGAVIYASLPQSALIARLDASQLARVRANPFVRWAGPMHAAYKTDASLARGYLSQFGADDPAARAEFERNWGTPYVKAMNRLRAGESVSFWIQVQQGGLGMKNVVAAAITAAGGKVQNITPMDNLMRAELNQAQLVQILHRDEVAFIDPWGPAENDMDIERTLSGANALEAATGMSGEGVRGEVMDAGFRSTHVGFTGPGPAPTIRTNSTDTSHGTCTFGIVFGDGDSNTAARALLPDAAAKYFYTYTSLSGFGGTADRLAVTTTAVNTNNIVFQSNSWGSALTTLYGTQSQGMDNIIWQTGLCICQSQSNAGSTSSRPEAWAKNVISVGGVTHLNDLNRANDTWGNGSSIGPAADLRIKPDLAHHYDSVLTTDSASDTAYTTGFGGTSAATPITCGYMGLIHQMWHGQVFPGFGGAASVFDSRPYFTTAKALAVHSAFRYNWTGSPSNPTINRNVQGWGVIDVEKLRQLAPTMFIQNEARNLLAGQNASYTFDVAPGATNFVATMVYRDPPGTTSSTIHRINDVSLKVTGPTGTFWWGNNGLTLTNVSTSGGVSNTKDTVENVFLTNPVAGRYRVQVFADIVTQDGNPRTAGVNDVTYALVVSGGMRTPLRVLTLDAARSGGCSDGSALSLTNGPVYAQVRQWLSDPHRFGGAGPFDRPVSLLPAAAELTTQALAGADVVVLTGAASGLSSCETNRLRQFMQQGGGVLAMYDNAGEDLANILGVNTGGTGTSNSFTTVGANGPILAGPFGTVTGPVSGSTHRIFTSIGAGIALLMDGADPVAAMFSLGTGKAIVVNDGEWASTASIDGCVTGTLPSQQNERFFLNSLAALAPAEPITFSFSACAADMNCDGTADIFDYLDFVQMFDVQAAASDFNRDGTIDFFDYLDFLAALNSGC